MIVIAIGKPKPNALSVARANSESRFAWGRTYQVTTWRYSLEPPQAPG